MRKRGSFDEGGGPLPFAGLSASHPEHMPHSHTHQAGKDANFPLARSRTDYFSSTYPVDHIPVAVDARIAALEKALVEVRFRLEEMEEDTGMRTRWGVRYSRRMAIVANIFVGLWRFLDVFLEILQKQRRQLMHSLLTRRSEKLNENISSLFEHTYKSGVRRSFVYLLCSLLLYSKFAWKRSLGLALSSFFSLYFVFTEPHQMTLGYYSTLFANLFYATASWSLATQKHSRAPPMLRLEPLSRYERLYEFWRQAIEHF